MTRARIVAAGALAVGVALVAVLWRAAGAPREAGATAAPLVSVSAVPLARGDVTQRVQIPGTLGYDGSFTVVDQLPPGILTSAAEPGTAVVRGADLFAVSGTPAVLLYGAAPAYRDFAAGMSDGPDVRELEDNLVALGMDPAHAITVDNHFAPATRAAILRWQAARGLPAGQRTGALPLGQVVFLPGALRAGSPLSTVGSSMASGTPVLSGTSTSRAVTAQLSTDRQGLVHSGDQVLVALPAGAPVTGTVARVGRVAAAPTSGSAGNGGPATVPVTITVALPAGSGDLDQSPVQVAVTVAQHRGVLLVPVTALLAKPGSGYQLRIIDGDGRRLVDVQPGLYDDATGTVEVGGAGLSEGMSVEVPAS